MTKKQQGIAITAVGAILLAIALIKFTIIGFYPSETLPYGILFAAGAAITWFGNKRFNAAKQAETEVK